MYFDFIASFNVTAGVRRAEILLTSYVGDADLYVTLNPEGTPGVQNAQYYSAHGGTGVDRVTVNAGDGYVAQYCSATDRSDNGTIVCTLRIAVIGYTASVWSIVAEASAYIVLADGVPQSDVVLSGAYNYYSFTVQSSNSTQIAFLVDPSVGK